MGPILEPILNQFGEPFFEKFWPRDTTLTLPHGMFRGHGLRQSDKAHKTGVAGGQRPTEDPPNVVGLLCCRTRPNCWADVETEVDSVPKLT